MADDISETNANTSLYNSCEIIAEAGQKTALLLVEGGASKLAALIRRGTHIGPSLARVIMRDGLNKPARGKWILQNIPHRHARDADDH